jgi:hypothetical protein
MVSASVMVTPGPVIVTSDKRQSGTDLLSASLMDWDLMGLRLWYRNAAD